jgi:hypothetical protein
MFFVMFAPYKEAYERSKIQSQTRNLLIFTDCIITIAIKKKKKEQGYRGASHQPLQNFFHPSKNSSSSEAHLLIAAQGCPRPICTSNSWPHSFSRAHCGCAAFFLNSCAAGVCGSTLARA